MHCLEIFIISMLVMMLLDKFRQIFKDWLDYKKNKDIIDHNREIIKRFEDEE